MCKKYWDFFYTFWQMVIFGLFVKMCKKNPGIFLHIPVFGRKTEMCKKNPSIFLHIFTKNIYFSKNVFEKQIIWTCPWCTEIFR